MGKIKSRHRTREQKCQLFQAEMKEKIEEFNIFVKQCFPADNLEDYKNIIIQASAEVHAIGQLKTLVNIYNKDILEAGTDYLEEVFVCKIIKVIQNEPKSEKTKEIPKLLEELRVGHREMQFYTELDVYLEMLLQWYHGNLKSVGFHAQ